MPRNRTIYASEGLFVGPCPATGQHFNSGNSGVNLVNQLHRIQSVGYDFNYNRTPINQYGEYASIDRPMLATPTVSLNFDYILANFHNENALGLVLDGYANTLSGILNKTRDERNYFIKTMPEGAEVSNNGTLGSDIAVIGIGNGFLNSYGVRASVGSLPMVSIGVEAQNMTFQSSSSGTNPAVNPADGTRITQWNYTVPTGLSHPGTGNLDISALRPGDITVTFLQRQAEDEGDIGVATDPYATAGASITDAKIQSFNLSFNLSRQALQKLGSRYAYSRESQFPVVTTLAIDAILGDLITGSLHDQINCDTAYDIQINMKQPNDCAGSAQTDIVRYVVKNAKLDGQSYSSSIGANKSVSLQFASEVGGPSKLNVGLFLSGLSSTLPGGYL